MQNGSRLEIRDSGLDCYVVFSAFLLPICWHRARRMLLFEASRAVPSDSYSWRSAAVVDGRGERWQDGWHRYPAKYLLPLVSLRFKK